MNKTYCDLCKKEIMGNDFVQQSIMVYYDLDDSADSDICKKCWEKEERKCNKNETNRKSN